MAEPTTVEEVVVTGKRPKKRKPNRFQAVFDTAGDIWEGAKRLPGAAVNALGENVANGNLMRFGEEFVRDPGGVIDKAASGALSSFGRELVRDPKAALLGLTPIPDAVRFGKAASGSYQANVAGNRGAGRQYGAEAASALPALAMSLIPAKGAGPIKAYHGSPHKFDRFDLSKLKTGQGATMYGEGLYFAQHPDVAQSYRTALAGPPRRGSVTFRNRPILTKGEQGGSWGMELPDVKDVAPRDVAADLLSRYGKVNDVIAQFRKFADETRSRWAEGVDAPDVIAWNPRVSRSGREANMRHELSLADTHDRMADFLERYGQDFKVRAPGYTYEVDINASPEQFLDWDKTLPEQSPLVRKALEDFAAEQASRMNAARDAGLARGVDFRGRPLSPERIEQLSRRALPEKFTGEGLYNALSRDEGAIREGEKGLETRRRLLDYGIVGNRYLDQGSRNAPGTAGTNNFVVFDDNLLNITDRYALGGLVEKYDA